HHGSGRAFEAFMSLESPHNSIDMPPTSTSILFASSSSSSLQPSSNDQNGLKSTTAQPKKLLLDNSFISGSTKIPKDQDSTAKLSIIKLNFEQCCPEWRMMVSQKTNNLLAIRIPHDR